MNELFIYELFRSILAYSKVIEGRFIVAPGYGNDLNTNNLETMVRDALGNISTPKKYPLAVMMPPIELVDDYNNGWSKFRLEMYFINSSFQNEGNGFDSSMNVSDHPITYDWKDMREVAGNFRRTFNLIVLKKHLLDTIREVQKQPDVIRRISLSNNDKLSGVRLNFEIELFTPCESTADYDVNEVLNVSIPSRNIHSLHKWPC